MAAKNPTRQTARELLANNLRILRAAKRLTQQELAEMASMDRGFLVALESASRRASMDTLDKLSKALGIAQHELLLPRDSGAR